MQYESNPLISSKQYKKAVARYDAVISCSNYIKQSIIKASNFPENKIYVIPNGVDYTFFSNTEQTIYAKKFWHN